jgi:hypothetical protein
VDHFLVRAAAESLGIPLWYYPDYPYAVSAPAGLVEKTGAGWQKVCAPVSREALTAWQDAVGGYASQISTFWGGLDEMRAAIETYWRVGGGTCLWIPQNKK